MTPLVLLPGLLCDGGLWADQIRVLSARMPVFVANLTRKSSIAEMARSVLDNAPPRFSLAGLSMGGYVCFEIMRQARDRVERLALLDTSARADVPEAAERRRGLIELAEKGKFKGVTPRLLPLLLHPDRLDDEALTVEVMAMAERVGKSSFIRQQTAILGRAESLPELTGYSCPTLVVCGRQDAITPLARAEEMALAITGSRLVVVEDCGHLSSMERPREVTDAMAEWLEL